MQIAQYGPTLAFNGSRLLMLEKEQVDMKPGVVVLMVSDVDRAKAFYENLGWRLDIDIAAGDFCVV